MNTENDEGKKGNTAIAGTCGTSAGLVAGMLIANLCWTYASDPNTYKLEVSKPIPAHEIVVDTRDLNRDGLEDLLLRIGENKPVQMTSYKTADGTIVYMTQSQYEEQIKKDFKAEQKEEARKATPQYQLEQKIQQYRDQLENGE